MHYPIIYVSKHLCHAKADNVWLQDKKSVRREQAEQDANNKDSHDDFETLNGSNANDDDEEWSTDVTAEAVKKRMEDLTLGNRPPPLQR